MLTGLLIFGVTYILISARRLHFLSLDRPAAALVGAVACVALGVLSPERALDAIDAKTIALLFGVMGMGAFLGADGFFDRSATWLAHRAGTPRRLVALVVWGAGALSALITNDAVCVLGAPLVVGLIERHRLAPLPFLLALATASNTGSVATLVGNPQNMLVASLGGLDYAAHLVLVGPIAIFGLALNHALLVLLFRADLEGRLEAPAGPSPITRRSALVLGVIGGSAVVYTLGADLAWTAVGGTSLLLVLVREDPREIWSRVDWSILVFFAGLFVVVEALVAGGAPAALFARFPIAGDGLGGWLAAAGVFLVGSNVVSNVPFILVVRGEMSAFADPRLAWELLAVASTFAGNLTLLGSVANVIVAEKAQSVGGFGFWAHLRVGLPVALATTALGALWLYAVG